MQKEKITLQDYLARTLSSGPFAKEIAGLLLDLSEACVEISRMTRQGALAGVLGSLGSQNVQGETQKKLDVLADEIFLEKLKSCTDVAGCVSEELDQPVVFKRDGPAPLLVIFDPLDGSSNIDVNVSVGSIFSVHRAPAQGAPSTGDFLCKGRDQLAGGYAVYGPATMLVLTVGQGTQAFTLDAATSRFVLTHKDLQVPAETAEFAINASNERFWEPPVKRYITECRAGKTDVREKDFNMRWVASMVAEVHRILMRGGVFLYPRDTKDPAKPGRLRLMYEASPMAMIIEQAGGLASNGRQRILDVVPEDVHQRIGVILGSRQEVERLERYHLEHDNDQDKKYSSPLFKERSLFQ